MCGRFWEGVVGQCCVGVLHVGECGWLLSLVLVWSVVWWCCFSCLLVVMSVNGERFRLCRFAVDGVSKDAIVGALRGRWLRVFHDCCCSKVGGAILLLVRGAFGGWMCGGGVIGISGSASAKISHGSCVDCFVTCFGCIVGHEMIRFIGQVGLGLGS